MIRAYWPAIVVVAGFGAFAAISPAQSQTAATPTAGTTATAVGTAVATPSATASLPSAADLLAKAHVAINAANTYHEVTVERLLVAKRDRQTIRSRTDVSIKPVLYHALRTTTDTNLTRHPPRTKVTHDETIVVDIVKASRVSNHAKKSPWSCASVKDADTSFAATLSNLNPTVQSEDTIGAETVDNVPVWHVRIVVTVVLGGDSVPVTSDQYIAQGDYTLIRDREELDVSLAGQKLNGVITSDYTHYGAPVSVALPQVCRGLRSTADVSGNVGRSMGDSSLSKIRRLVTDEWQIGT